MTTINPEFGRASTHRERETLVEAQAMALGMPLVRMYVRAGSYPTAANDLVWMNRRTFQARRTSQAGC
ncbi:hypothetical protein [Bradyrhizobium tropiciagri]|uniref:hypothetical protein n=1 Tax=Bradyrhizobium tropiciagri TaxID=312253 RepID=UPI000AF58F0E|nr:hypothetical protein [Bradyrhizobium tropiciagri]